VDVRLLEGAFPGGYVGVPGVRCAGGQRVVVVEGQATWHWPSTNLLYRPGSDVFEEAAARGELYPDLLDGGTLLLLLQELSCRFGLDIVGNYALGASWSPRLTSRSRSGGRRPEVACWVLRVADGAERRFSVGTSDPLESLLLAFAEGGAGSRTRVSVGSRSEGGRS
jgi:hypothetical protein